MPLPRRAVPKAVVVGALWLALIVAGCSGAGGADGDGANEPAESQRSAEPTEPESSPPGEPGGEDDGGGEGGENGGGGGSAGPDGPPPTPARPAEESACPLSAGGGGTVSKVSYAAADDSSVPRGIPWPDRPVVRLCFDVTEDPSYVQGHETIRFVPDQLTCEVVFRSWPNKPSTAEAGNRLDVGAVAVDGAPVTPKVESGGAPKGWPGTVIRVPLPDCLGSGDEVTIDLGFVLTLGDATAERVGYSAVEQTVWLGSAYPMLAWERERGWAVDPAVDLYGESVTSEVYHLAGLEVVTVEGAEVAGTGRSEGVSPGPRKGTEVHRFTDPAVRDVAVTVGAFTTMEQVEVEGVRVWVFGPSWMGREELGVWRRHTVEAIEDLTEYLGPFPYRDLWMTVVPDVPTGIEFPGAIMYGPLEGDDVPRVVRHEVAHQWFYGLVGNNQGSDPWLDESFAEYAEVLLTLSGREPAPMVIPPPVRNRVGESMTWYADLGEPPLYGLGVYRQGGIMLHQARQAVGPQRWDRLIRDYLTDNAHTIVTPNDVRAAFESEPEAIAILEEFGALD